jgi:hypothetical protein
MSKEKFTQEIYNVVAESGNFHYRVVPAWTDHIISDEEAKANEKLFLNAPKMYSALESSLQMLEQTLAYRNANGIRFGNVFLECTIDQVKEALSNAAN